MLHPKTGFVLCFALSLVKSSVAAITDTVVWIIRIVDGRGGGGGLVLLERVPTLLLSVHSVVDAIVGGWHCSGVVHVSSIVIRVVVVAVRVGRVRANGAVATMTAEGPVVVVIVNGSTLSDESTLTMSPGEGLEDHAQEDQTGDTSEHDVEVGGEGVIDIRVRGEEAFDGLGEACASKEVDADDGDVSTDDGGGGDEDTAAQEEGNQETDDRGTDKKTDATTFTADETLVSPGEDVEGDGESCDATEDPDREPVEEPADKAEDETTTDAGEDVDDLTSVPSLSGFDVGEDRVDDHA